MQQLAADNARHAIQNLLDGNAPNGIAPADCGAWAETVQALFDAHAAGGSGAVRRAWDAVTRTQPGAAQLVAGDGTAQAWGPILPFHNADLPAFPLELFPDWLRDYCAAVTETMQTPTDLAGMLALAVLSTACARYVEVKAWEGYIEPVNIYTVVSMPPGSGKSPVFKLMTSPISMYEYQELEKSQERIVQADDQRDILENRIAEAKRKAARADGENAMKLAHSDVEAMRAELQALEVPTKTKLIIDDATPESVTSILAEQGGRIAVLSSEGDIFAIMSGRYSSGAPNIGVYKKGHVGDDIRVDRRTRSEIVRKPAITMGITTQPDVMRAFGQNKTFQSEGLLARFFYAMPRSLVGSRKMETEPIPGYVKDTYYHRILNLLENCRNCRNCRSEGDSADQGDSRNNRIDQYNDISNNISILEISQEAKERFTRFRQWLEPQRGPYGALAGITDWASKLDGYVLRLAGLLHMADVAAYNSYNSYNSNVISDATLARAIRFTSYLIPHALAAYAEIGTDPAVEGARLVLRWIEKSDARAFSKQQCYQGVKGTLKRADDLDPVLSLLCDHGYLREIEAPPRVGPGRKAASSYEANPAMFESSSAAYNSYNSYNAPGAGFAPPMEDAADDSRGYREIEGF